MEAADCETESACFQDHRTHLDCGADLRMARPQPSIQQGLRIPSANLRDSARYCCHASHAQSARTGMKLFKHALNSDRQRLPQSAKPADDAPGAGGVVSQNCSFWLLAFATGPGTCPPMSAPSRLPQSAAPDPHSTVGPKRRKWSHRVSRAPGMRVAPPATARESRGVNSAQSPPRARLGVRANADLDSRAFGPSATVATTADGGALAFELHSSRLTRATVNLLEPA